MGSIPAQAGQPGRIPLVLGFSGVHPRAGGATKPTVPPGVWPTGPSPRRRGNPCDVGSPPLCPGSIPAQAGQPLGRAANGQASRVHPRAGGATPSRQSDASLSPGPSPRRRGNLQKIGGGNQVFGSIPAQAGQPANFGGGRGQAVSNGSIPAQAGQPTLGSFAHLS